MRDVNVLLHDFSVSHTRALLRDAMRIRRRQTNATSKDMTR
jgi:hypothetical protein